MKHLAWLAAFLFPSLGFAADWPEFRGPSAQGHYQGPPLPLEWGKDKNIRWKQPLAGHSWSSPVIVGDRIYLTSAVPNEASEGKNKDHALRVLCLAKDSGKTLWDKEVFQQDGKKSPAIHSKNSHASPTPIIQDGKIYVHFGHQGTACLDTEGKVLWTHVEKYAPVHGNGGSPVLVEGLLIFSADGASNPRVLALDAETGKVRWKKDRSVKFDRPFSFCTPLVIDVKGKKQVVAPASGGVVAYEPKTGDEVWQVRYDGYSVVPRPVFGHGMVFLSTGYNTPSTFAIKVDGQGDVTDTHVAWKKKEGSPHNPSPILVGDDLFTVSDGGVAACIEVKTGTVHWKERVGGAYSSSLMFADGKIYFLNEEGTCTVIPASRTFEKLASNELGERCQASMAAADGIIYLRTAKHLYAIQAK